MNRALDRLPPAEIRIGYRSVPTFLIAGLSGLAAANFVFVALTALAGADVLVALGLVPIAAVACLALAIMRRRGGRIEQWVLLEHLALGLTAIAGALSLAGEPIVPWLDRVFAGFAVLFTFGRLGCTSAGCCYGHRSSFGIDHGPSHVAPGRRFPVQLVEAACWASCAALAIVLSLVAPAGIAFATTALLYATTRFFLEGMRADPRPHLLGMSESRWLALGLAAAALLVLYRCDHMTNAGPYVGGAGLLATVVAWATARSWLTVPAETTADARGKVADFGRGLAARGPDDATHRLEVGSASIVASWLNTGKGHELYVSVSATSPGVMGPAEAELLLEEIGVGLGIRGETPMLVETAPGHYVTRFARDEVHIIVPTVQPRREGASNAQRYFAPQTDLSK